jgi:hypothetical protein
LYCLQVIGQKEREVTAKHVYGEQGMAIVWLNLSQNDHPYSHLGYGLINTSEASMFTVSGPSSYACFGWQREALAGWVLSSE